jgi:uncharacterized protein DUF4412
VKLVLFLGAQLLAIAAFADLTIVLETTRPGKATVESTLFASGGNWRLENSEGGFLHRSRQDGYFALDHGTKSYRMVTARDALLPENLDELIWEKSGKNEKIGGILAQHWKGRKGKAGKVRAEVWFGGEVHYFEDLADETQGVRGSALEYLASIPGRFPIKDGYILKYIEYGTTEGTRTILVKRVDRKPVDEKWFQLPADYTSSGPAVPPGNAKPPEPPPFNPESVPPLGTTD